jgi:hypothetical protein
MLKMNRQLLKEFSMVEVDVALKQMHLLKSPGPDGKFGCFDQNSWEIVRNEVCTAILDFLNNGIFYASINDTYTTLIPKVKNPFRIIEYIIAKVLANKVKKVLQYIILVNQSAFILGRLITDNILVAFEAFQTMDIQMKGKKGVYGTHR